MTTHRRIGCIGDIHAEDELLEAAINGLRARSVDAIVAVGDIVDGRGDLARTIHLLIEHEIMAVRGNHDRWLSTDRIRNLPHAHRREDLDAELAAYLDALPTTRTIETTFGVLLVCHAVGDEDMMSLLPDTPATDILASEAFRAVCDDANAAIMVCGHTHVRMVRAIGPVTVVNAGTLRATEKPGFVVVDTDARRVEAFDIAHDRTVIQADSYAFGGVGRDVWESF